MRFEATGQRRLIPLNSNPSTLYHRFMVMQQEFRIIFRPLAGRRFALQTTERHGRAGTQRVGVADVVTYPAADLTGRIRYAALFRGALDKQLRQCYSFKMNGSGHFCLTLHVAMQSGLYHHPLARGVVSSLYTFRLLGLARYCLSNERVPPNLRRDRRRLLF
jgi:hypothetical protein